MTENGASSYHRYLQGDPHALEELVRAYSDSLTRYAFLYLRDPFLAEDVMEDSFAVLISKRKRLPDTEHFQAYLFRIVRNKCLDLLRSKRSRELSLTGLEEVLRAEDPEKDLLNRARDAKVFECLSSLPADYRDALYLTYFEGYKPAELAGFLGGNRKRAYNLLSRAKAALKEILLKEGIGHEDL